MPRTADANSCLTCRRRRIRCDNRLPICERCEKRDVYCDRSSPLVVKQYTPESGVDLDKTPRELLQEALIAKLFHVYIKDLAPWYDLCDETKVFEKEVAEKALDSILLFSACIASSAIYMCRKESFPRIVAESYHDRCVRLLLTLSGRDQDVQNGAALASTCLLRTYEILSEDEDPNRHLFGASTLLPPTPSFGDHSLTASGFWNFLRADITYALMHECALKVRLERASSRPLYDDDATNSMTLLLGRAINRVFGQTSDDVLPEVIEWRRLASKRPFSRIDDRPFPSIRMLRDSHVAAMQCCHAAICLLQPEERYRSAQEICGLAMCSESVAVLVNSYGIIVFAAQFLEGTEEQQTLVDFLRSSERRTGWSVGPLVSILRGKWGGNRAAALNQ